MAEVIIPPGFGNAVMIWQPFGRTLPYTVTLGFGTAGLPVATPADFANIIMDTITETNCPADNTHMYTSWSFLGVHVLINQGGTLMSGDSDLPPVVGTITPAQETPANSSLLVAKQTGVAGRAFRGRMYAPFTATPATQFDRYGNIDTTTVSGLQFLWGTFRTLLVDAEVPPYLLHAAADDAPTLITNFVVRPKVGTQRRRIR